MGRETEARPPLAALRIHIEHLLAEHLVSADYRPDCTPAALADERHVVVAPVADRHSYTVALRQIARVVVGEGQAAELWIREHSLLLRSELRVLAIA